MEPPANGSLKELVQRKEQEWRELQELRLETLEISLKEKERQCLDLQAKFDQLKDDFKYNLKLLEERDQELERFERFHAEMKGALNTKVAEISEGRIKIADLESVIKREHEARDQLQTHYKQKLIEKHVEYDKQKSDKDKEVNREKNHVEAFKRNLERRLLDMEDELNTQKQELTSGFDEAMCRREREFRAQADEMSNRVIGHELRVKVTTRELEIVKSRSEKICADNLRIYESNQSLEKQLHRKCWELNDLQAMSDARVKDLKQELEQAEMLITNLQTDFERRYQERDTYARGREVLLANAKQSHVEKEQLLEKAVHELKGQLDSAQLEIKRLGASIEDLDQDKDHQTQRHQEELRGIQHKFDSHIAREAQDTVSRDVELEAMRASEKKIKGDILQRKQDIERYKKDLVAASEREVQLERSKTQLELDWQRRYDDVERVQYEKAEELVKQVSSARDEALAAKQEIEKILKHKEKLIRVLIADRDRAFSVCKQNGLTVDMSANMDTREELQKQNDGLRDVIREMRRDMENLGQEMPPESKQGPVVSDYVRNLESEVRELKVKVRNFEVKGSDAVTAAGQSKALEKAVEMAMKDNTVVKNHVEALNNRIATLQTQKVEVSAELKRYKTRLEHQEKSLEHFAKEPRQKQVVIEQLQYDLDTQNRRNLTEVTSLRKRVSDLELQLDETRKEADEYKKQGLERNFEAERIANEELVIQQLQDEVGRMRDKILKVDRDSPVLQSRSQLQGDSGDQLKIKLHQAAKHIKRLAEEKQQLIQVGNRMRSELNKAGIQFPKPTKPSGSLPSNGGPPIQLMRPQTQRHVDHVQNKLNQLEKLQYQLTRQELQMAQRQKSSREPQVLVDSFTSESPSSESDIKHRKSGRPQHRPTSATGIHTRPDHIAARPHSREERATRPANRSSTPADLGWGLRTMSSVGDESLQDVWNMLDERQTPSLFPSSPKP